MYLPSACASLRMVFAIGHLRFTHVGFHFVFAHHAVNDDFPDANSPMPLMMVWPESGSVATLNVGSSCADGQRNAHLFLVALGLGLDATEITGAANVIDSTGSALYRADGVARGDVLQTHAGADIAGVNLADFLALVGVHLQQTANALRLPYWWCSEHCHRFQLPRSRHATNTNWPTNESAMNLESEPGERLMSAGLRSKTFPVIGIVGREWPR